MMNYQFPEATQIPAKDIPSIMIQLNALQSALAARLIAEQSGDAAKSEPEDKLITIKEAADLLTVSPDWLYRRHKNLPFTHRLSRKGLRFSKRDLLSWRNRQKH
jgi:hypothetical protein